MTQHEIDINTRKWGTYGKSPDLNNLKLQWVKIKDLSNNHIFNILETQLHIGWNWRLMFTRELDNRKRDGVVVDDVERYANYSMYTI